jgi:hypothetical protein
LFNKEGFLYKPISSSNNDIALFGDWRNCKFSSNIQSSIDDILSLPEVAATLECYYLYVTDANREEEEKQLRERKELILQSGYFDESQLDLAIKIIDEEYKKELERKSKSYQRYGPIYEHSTISLIANK